VQALEIAPDSAEPLQALASLKYELGDAANALDFLRASMRMWWHPCDGHDDDEATKLMASNSTGKEVAISQERQPSQEGGGHAEMVHDAVSSPARRALGFGAQRRGGDGPSYEFRLECCKLLIELDETTDVVIEVRIILCCLLELGCLTYWQLKA
jgi:hypothetical protein